MTWSDFYLICFAVGFCFSFFSFVFGSSRLGRLHLPHFHGHAGGHLPTAHGPVAHAPATSGDASAHGTGHSHAKVTVSPFNPPSIAAFLAWFGGTGYLLTRFSAFWVGTALSLAVLAGVIGAAIIFFFLTRILMSDQEYLDPADFEMVGVLGKLSVPIREGGTGELIYSQMGTRRVCGARSEEGGAIAKGTEVVVTRYDKGIAYVRLWSEMSGELDETNISEKTSD
ncbi:MAG TPA: NfeD family protein [Candidatus Sulfotelmatobacter sp.]|nr:NfeD family protein [Candidatus Sulfotelmatobacter sp.]